MWRCVLFLVWILIGSIDVTQYHQRKTLIRRNESWALSQIEVLPEVKSFMKRWEKNKATLMVQGEPNANSKYYWIAMGLSNLGMFRTSVNFFIDPKTGAIFIGDTMDNSGDEDMHQITLRQWRHWYNDPRFANFHTIRGNKLLVLDLDGKVIYDTKKSSRVNR